MLGNKKVAILGQYQFRPELRVCNKALKKFEPNRGVGKLIPCAYLLKFELKDKRLVV
jgi:hypothetical protein